MKFNKAVLINIAESALDAGRWQEFDTLVGERVHLPKDSPEILSKLADVDCLFTGFGIPVTKEMINAAPLLKYVGALATAFGKIDIQHAREKGIKVTNVPGYSTGAVAEFTIAAILEIMHSIEEGKRRGKEGNYSEDGIRTREIKGKIFGIVGLGRIGRRIAELAQCFGADVRYWSRQKKDVPFKYQDADSLLKEADILSINLAETPETEKFLNNERVDSLKSGAIIICTAPMELVNIDALAARLAQGDITFIFEHSDETSREDLEKLSQYKNCVIYPPMANITDEAKQNKQQIFMENIRGFLEDNPINVVNS